MYSTRDHDTLVFHEGAHVYLFHLGYPPAQMRRIDFINEYYACKLELQKRFDDDPRKLDELIGDLGTKRIELEALLGPVGQAIATKLREYWGLGKKPSNCTSIFGQIYDCLERAPNPPNYPEKQCRLMRLKKARSSSSLENHSRGSIWENKFRSLKNLSILRNMH